MCVGELGCLNTTDEWYGEQRPYNPVPDKRHTVKTTFLLHSKSSKPEGDLVPVLKKSINVSGFNRSWNTMFLIHDFTSNGYTGWIRHLSGALLNQSDRNIFAVDWEAGAQPPYVMAISNARIVALEIAYMIKMLLDHFKVRPTDIHLIGHGLGAHIAGYVGESITGLDRITGLDPSGPYFQGMPPVVRLDLSDANFVDVIHTDMNDPGSSYDTAQGTADLSGHIDFYPNGGMKQPGCVASPDYPGLLKLTRESIKPGTIYPGCSHKRAFKYFIESVVSKDCPFMSYECPNYNMLLQGECEETRRSVMGMDALQFQPRLPGRFYLTTSHGQPFCQFRYRVELQLAKPKSAKTHVEGTLMLSIVNQGAPPITMELVSSLKRAMKHGETQCLVGYHAAPLVCPVDKAELAWWFHSSAWMCLLCNESLYVSNITVTSRGMPPNNNGTVSTLCSCDGNPIAEVKNNSTHVFIPCKATNKT